MSKFSTSLKIVTGLTILGFVTFYSCKKDKKDEPAPSTNTTSTQTVTAQDTTDAVENSEQANQAVEATTLAIGIGLGADSASAKKASCPTFSRQDKKIVVDFGTSGCEVGGNMLYGVVMIESSVSIVNIKKGSNMTVTFTDFIIDTIKFNGVATIIVEDSKIGAKLNPPPPVYWIEWVKGACTIKNLQITNTNKKATAVLNISATIKWETMSTMDNLEDDRGTLYSPASFSGTDYKGRGFEGTVLTDITFLTKCMEPVKGTLEITPANKVKIPKVNIDCGSGSCDGEIEIKIGPKTTTKKI